jgi:SAM-dependent methyltransferase
LETQHVPGTRIETFADLDGSLLPGVPADYLLTPIFREELRALAARQDVLRALMADTVPLPTTDAREGYFGPRHLEYWLSGRRDAALMATTTELTTRKTPRVLDFGGATGRVARHIRAICPGAEVFLSDINPRHVACCQRIFGGSLHAFRNQGIPSLPLPDNFLDAAYAFSVLTHLDVDDTAWLLELRRVVRPGGAVYVTVHDDATWDQLADLAPANPQFLAPDLVALRERQPRLTGKVVHYYNENADYACNAFVSRDHVQKVWAPLFVSWRLEPMVHDHQAALIFEVP